MISPEDTVCDGLLLQNADFPDNYIDMHHPDDGKVFDRPISPEYIFHQRYPERIRLILRISVKNTHGYIPLSLICDTGAPNTLYLSPKFRDAFQHLTRRDDDMGIEYLETRSKDGKMFRMKIVETPHIHHHANILGLKALMRFGLQMTAEGFTFNNLPEYLST